MSAYSRDLKNIFSAFCQFGASKSSLQDLAGGGAETMDNARFAKFAKDSRILDKALTMTDVDIIFNKVKSRGGRRLEFEDFLLAIQELAAVKYRGTPRLDAFNRFASELCRANPSPIATATIPKVDSTLSRLTDTSKYTGTHKERFDQNGKGLGLAGRDQPSKTDSLSKLTNREPSTIRGVPISAARATGTAPLAGVAAVKRDRATVFSNDRLESSSSNKVSHASSSSPSNSNSSGKSKGSLNNLSGPTYGAKSGSGNIFDRLTDTSKYTGTHKERFDQNGRGLGLAGRDSVAKGSGTFTQYRGGDVKNLAQILRN